MQFEHFLHRPVQNGRESAAMVPPLAGLPHAASPLTPAVATSTFSISLSTSQSISSPELSITLTLTLALLFGSLLLNLPGDFQHEVEIDRVGKETELVVLGQAAVVYRRL